MQGTTMTPLTQPTINTMASSLGSNLLQKEASNHLQKLHPTGSQMDSLQLNSTSNHNQVRSTSIHKATITTGNNIMLRILMPQHYITSSTTKASLQTRVNRPKMQKKLKLKSQASELLLNLNIAVKDYFNNDNFSFLNSIFS